MEAQQQETIASFMSLANCDADFARSFLEANGWNLELAVSSFYGEAGGVPGLPTANGGGPVGDADGVADSITSGIEDPLAIRAPIAQFSDTLIGDPAQPVLRRPPTNAADHPLEAFRDFRNEGASTSGDGDGASPGDVFGMPKRPKNLSELYRPPIELCFSGTFEELRQTGRQQSRWLLVNIQSPTEFASQQLNADTWSDEGLRVIIGSSFLFWQQYFDSDDGSKYCRHYLAKWPTYPHIGLIDPVTGQLVKCWSGFVSAERLIDKLMDFADKPPKDVVFSSDVPMTEAGGGQPVSEDAQLAQALAMSKEGRSAPMANEPTNASVHRPKEPWPSAPECPESGAPGSVVLRVRLPNGQNFMQAFSLEHTLRDVCCIVHHKAGVPLSTTKSYQLASHGSSPFTNMDGTLASFGLSGRVAVNLSEQE